MSQQTDRSPVMGQPLIFTVSQQENGRQLVRVMLRRYPQLRPAVVYQALRRRDIKVNGQRIRSDCAVMAGDSILAYLPPANQADEIVDPGYTVIQHSGSVWVINKLPGLSVQTGSVQKPQGPTLLELARRDLNPQICLCHRLDRQTGGLIILAAGQDACRSVRDQMHQGLVSKRYRCLVQGIPASGMTLSTADGQSFQENTAWLEKQAANAQVYIHQKKQPGDLPITTRYRVLRVFPNAGPDGEAVSELLVELVTGRTHQIRAHLAFLGHPLLGDGKYGRNAYNHHFTTRQGRLKHQELWATTLIFDQRSYGPLQDLAGQTIEIKPAFAWTGYHEAGQDGLDI